MFTNIIENETTNKLNNEIKKLKNNFAFNKFINERANSSQKTFNNLFGQTTPSNSYKNIQTFKDEDGSIVTQEIATVPFVYIQAKTILRPDGTKIYINYFPNNEEQPSKIVEYSAQSMVTKTTTFESNGNAKTEERIIKYPDGTSVKELTEFKHQRKTRKTQNSENITIKIESFINNKLIYELNCDKEGTLKKESYFYSFSQRPILSKEITYHSNIAYTEKEYSYTGELTSVMTKSFGNKYPQILKRVNQNIA